MVAVLRDRQLADSNFQGREVGGESNHIYLPLETGLARLKREELSAELDTLKVKLDASIDPAAAVVIGQGDVAVVEAGCGGRFDLTNLVEPIATVVTNVGRDHILSLGPTVDDIAWRSGTGPSTTTRTPTTCC